MKLSLHAYLLVSLTLKFRVIVYGGGKLDSRHFKFNWKTIQFLIIIIFLISVKKEFQLKVTYLQEPHFIPIIIFLLHTPQLVTLNVFTQLLVPISSFKCNASYVRIYHTNTRRKKRTKNKLNPCNGKIQKQARKENLPVVPELFGNGRLWNGQVIT